MTGTIRLRDHNQPCEHGYKHWHIHATGGEHGCPGGRLVEATVRYECATHDSLMQSTICEKHDLACRRLGRNPFAGKNKCKPVRRLVADWPEGETT